VKPEIEYAARQLAATVLEGERTLDGRFHGFEDAIHPSVTVELRGMVKTIRREFLLDGATIAERVKLALEKQLGETDLEAVIAQEVARHVAGLKRSVAAAVDEQMKTWVRDQVNHVLGNKYEQVRAWADVITRDALKKVGQ
jgi:hypothetical protein